MEYSYVYDFGKIGKITVTANENALTALCFVEKITGTVKESDLIKKTYTELSEYFNGKRKTFDIPVALNGTKFQKKVWRALCDIPYGKTISYKELAAAVGNEKACRAVGMANNKNKIAIIIPCHRVIGSGGNLVGYAAGVDIKRFLLDLEMTNSDSE